MAAVGWHLPAEAVAAVGATGGGGQTPQLPPLPPPPLIRKHLNLPPPPPRQLLGWRPTSRSPASGDLIRHRRRRLRLRRYHHSHLRYHRQRLCRRQSQLYLTLIRRGLAALEIRLRRTNPAFIRQWVWGKWVGMAGFFNTGGRRKNATSGRQLPPFDTKSSKKPLNFAHFY